MNSVSNPNLQMLEVAVVRLGVLLDEFVFLMEDIVAVLDGRPVIVGEVRQSVSELRTALAERFRDLLNEQRFVDAVSGHMPTDEASQARVPVVIDRMRQIAETE